MLLPSLLASSQLSACHLGSQIFQQENFPVLCERQHRHTNIASVNKVLNWAGLLKQAQDTNCLNTSYQENIYSYQLQTYTFVWIEGVPLQRVFQPLGYYQFQQNFQRTWLESCKKSRGNSTEELIQPSLAISGKSPVSFGTHPTSPKHSHHLLAQDTWQKRDRRERTGETQANTQADKTLHRPAKYCAFPFGVLAHSLQCM